ncbi:MAG: DUF2442 domain-containing protein [Lachnospiraceae bacterium]|nr:DUF2442 domain-containing protein [Lachnospiraceae bacterium]
MFEKIVKINAQDNFQLIAEFSDGSVKQYDAYPALSEIKEFQVLLDHPERFYDVKTVCCGSGIAWDDSMDIASEEIWEHGTAVLR